MNVGIIGGGFFGEMHARAIAELPGLHLTAVSRRDTVSLDAFCRRFGGKGYSDYAELLVQPTVDVVVIATPHETHTRIALAAAMAGKHILLEKPMALSLEDCDAIIAAARKAGVKLMVGHVNRFAKAYRTARRILDSGEMGQVVLGVSAMSKFWMEQNRRPWHMRRDTGGGMWLSAGMHCLDRLVWLVGSSVTHVSAQFETRFHDQSADDVGMIFIRFENEAFGTVVSTAYREGAPKHLTELTCTKGMLNIEYNSGVSIGRAEQWKQVPDSSSTDWMHEALVEEWRAFVESIDRDIEEPVTGDFARHIMEVVFAAEESSRLKKEIGLDAARHGSSSGR